MAQPFTQKFFGLSVLVQGAQPVGAHGVALHFLRVQLRRKLDPRKNLFRRVCSLFREVLVFRNKEVAREGIHWILGSAEKAMFLTVLAMLVMHVSRFMVVVPGFLARAFGEMVLFLRLRLVENARVITAVKINIRTCVEMVREEPPAVAKHRSHEAIVFPRVQLIEPWSQPGGETEATGQQKHER